MTNQIEIPPSFSQLFRHRSGRLLHPASTVLARYELCEDLACALVEQAQSLYHGGHSDEAGVLLGLHGAISGPDAGLSPSEAHWVVQRLAELLQWKAPLLPAAPATAD
ncbi:hypothetical protein ACFO3A_13175 [Comamonas nitrativorans]|uniref:ATPase with chaperone activity n=1 Tax=Comamonas nitrativorans TaxID=108437 RepID=A0ABV9GZG8_9BURK